MYWRQKDRVLSALWIAGTLESEISPCVSAIFPMCDFDLEHDVDALPTLQAAIDRNSSQGIENSEMRKYQAIQQMMAIITQRTMPELLIFRGHLGLFTMITFASYYFIGVSSIGLLTKTARDSGGNSYRCFRLVFRRFQVERFTRPSRQSVFILILTNCKEPDGKRRFRRRRPI
jgi:hypothetical protein